MRSRVHGDYGFRIVQGSAADCAPSGFHACLVAGVLMQADAGCAPSLCLIGEPACVLVMFSAAGPCSAHKAM